ncbi:unnamed protein product [Paramecium octaurelia]|uniref:Uncharacterized protein n=1 Tax=Paramecium octaurelia TaxID=43137 RepID=A0A8S1W4P9_PAROT|nr:unnamed protein product [Paramecium octaurelia]
MNSQTLDEESCQIKNEKNHGFGPCLNNSHLEAKKLEDEANINLNVFFKQKNDVIIVENWKRYNTDVSKHKLKNQQNNIPKNQCCTTF